MKFNPFTLFAIILLVTLMGFVMHDARTTGFTGSAVKNVKHVDKHMKKVLIEPKQGANINAIKTKLKVRHDFGNKFSAEVDEQEIHKLSRQAYIHELKTFEILIKQDDIVCNDGICSPGESHTCPTDCNNVVKRDCFPSIEEFWNTELIGSVQPRKNVKVVYVDTGVAEHDDLKVRCRDFTTPELKGACTDTHGHGTHVAGIIAANGGKRNLGIFGVAQGANLVAHKVCEGSICYEDDVAMGIYEAGKKGADIISISLGGGDSALVKDAIDFAAAKGVLLIAASGNTYGPVLYPAKYDNVVAVGAITPALNWATFSGYGPEIEFAAPGVSIYSTLPWCYGYSSGTSMAAPHVAGAAAVVWQGDAESTRLYLREIAQDLGAAGWDPKTGYGVPILP